jgi:hypothetical protein
MSTLSDLTMILQKKKKKKKEKKTPKKVPSLIDESFGRFISCIANKCVIKLIFQVTYVMLFGPCIRGLW